MFHPPFPVCLTRTENADFYAEYFEQAKQEPFDRLAARTETLNLSRPGNVGTFSLLPHSTLRASMKPSLPQHNKSTFA
jgi:hypothetical protein